MSSLFNINVHNGLTFSNDNSTLSVAAVSGTDTAGKNLTIAAGQGTGTGTGGSIIFQTADGDSGTGSSVNSLVTAMTIADDGNIGIGTSSPGTLLQLEGATPYLTLKNSTSENTDGGCESKIIFEDHADATLAQIQASHDGTSDDTKGDLIFSTHNGTSLTERLRIDSAGNVGIGTSPDCILDLEAYEGKINLKTTNSSNFSNINLESSGGDKWHISGPRGATEGNLGFYYVDGGSFSSELLSITKDGKVGIGTDSPLGVTHFHGNGTSIDIINQRDSTHFSVWHVGSTDNSILWQSGGAMRFRTIGSLPNGGGTQSEYMRIQSNGNVGIGTSTPRGLLQCKSSGSNGGGNMENLNQASLILTNNANDTCALAMHTDTTSLGFHFSNSDSGTVSNYIEKAYINGSTSGSTQMNFTGQHKNLMNQNIDTTQIGLIVSTTNNHINIDNSILPTINESLPYCVLTNTDNDKKVFGVISDKEDTNTTREYSTGNFVSTYEKSNTNEQRLFINSLGEGAIWVCNKNGSLENGDYITSTSVPGYGGKQILNEGFLMNYTVAKITRDCDFSLTKIVKQKLKVITSTDNDGNTTSSIDYDANGDPQYEDDLDENGNQQMVYPLETRFLQANGTLLTDEDDYNTRLGNGEEVCIACFVGCTYHCG